MTEQELNELRAELEVSAKAAAERKAQRAAISQDWPTLNRDFKYRKSTIIKAKDLA